APPASGSPPVQRRAGAASPRARGSFPGLPVRRSAFETKCRFVYPEGVPRGSKGRRIVKRLWLLAPAAVLALVLVASIPAAKPGPGTSTGTGRVFVPNPVQSLGDESLTDQKDSDSAVPANAYYAVTLTNLDGSGFLRGDWANIVSETGNRAYSPTNTFNYTRSQDEYARFPVSL